MPKSKKEIQAKYREKLKSLRLCHWCKKPLTNTISTCGDCQSRKNERRKEKAEILKQQNKCQRCGNGLSSEIGLLCENCRIQINKRQKEHWHKRQRPKRIERLKAELERLEREQEENT